MLFGIGKKYVLIGAGVAVVLAGVGAFAFRGDGTDGEVVAVERRTLVEEVRIAGQVEAARTAAAGFSVSGRVAAVFVGEGETVAAGEPVMRLDLGTLPAELDAARADVVVKEAEVKNADARLAAVEAEQDALVASAYRTLLSGDLVAVPKADNVSLTPPTVSGAYDGTEGRYKFRVEVNNSRTEYQLVVFELEKAAAVEAEGNKPTPLGTRGLSVEFPDGVSAYEDTEWYVSVPNPDGDSYAANKSAYESALKTRERAIEEANADVATGRADSSVVDAALARARAEVRRIEALIAERTIVAPFAGTVADIAYEPGEIVAANTVAATLISSGRFGVKVNLPEVDTVKVSVGDAAVVTLDALGDEEFPAVVESVARTETIVDGVPAYEARLAFLTDDPRIASGMTADALITTETRDNALALPFRVLRRTADGFVADVLAGDGVEPRVVTLGIRSADGFAEITSGLAEGERVLAP